ncbi:hypothetical protein ACHAQH_006999 [Verticillium albo-atrum]
MWLLSTKSLTLHCFLGSPPPYSILSHTWEDEEVTHQEILKPTEEVRCKAGYRKISSCAAKSSQMGLEYTWVDTCCIDKSSSAELSEAINSMFAWYRDSATCLVYLQDYQPGSSPPCMVDIGLCKWFTRGWTLQEILAPKKAIFYSADWTVIGTKDESLRVLSSFLRIELAFLKPKQYQEANVATKMSWAARRATTRPEDIAYCLMGLFGVNMPLLYGEGTKAFTRLQEEIIKTSDDTSVLMWRCEDDSSFNFRGPLARSPSEFLHSSPIDTISQTRIPLCRASTAEPYDMTNKGLRLTVPLCSLDRISAQRVHPTCHERLAKLKSDEGVYADGLFLALLSWTDSPGDYWSPFYLNAWLVRRLRTNSRHFVRAYPGTLLLVEYKDLTLRFEAETIYIKEYRVYLRTRASA